MKIQSVVHDVRQRIETAGRQYQGAFKAYVDAQRKALTVVSRNGQSLANTEIGAAKNIYASARASFERARADGVRQLASQPTSYLPSSRPQLIAAYKTTIDLLVKTGNELNDVVSNGYRSVWGQLSGQAGLDTSETQSDPASSPARKTAARRKSASAATSTSTRKTASTSKATGTQTASASKSSPKKSAAPRKRAASPKTASAPTTAANSPGDSSSNDS